ncbi:(Fe-S)-binding protein [Clostridium botulinum]|nr:(Fe-S)-binding protein [Clostridium botulinum]
MNKKYFYIKDEKRKRHIESIRENCVQCNLCVKNCPMLEQFGGNPKKIFDNIITNGSFEAILPYSCTICGKCKEVCPKDLDMPKAFMDLRLETVEQNNGATPLKGHNSIHMHQKWSFSKVFTKYVGDKNRKTNKVERVFFPGCTLSSYSPELVLKTYEYLKEKLPGTSMLLECCGKPTESLGEQDKFNKLFMNVEKHIKNTGAVEVITACQNCYMIMKKYGKEIKVKSLWSVLQEIGLPKNAVNKGIDSEVKFSIHDSCVTRYEEEIQNSIRWIMKELGYEVLEGNNIRSKTNCCGTGGMIHAVNFKVSNAMMREAAKKIGQDYIVTYCAGCREAMIKGGAKSLHILDLIFKDTIATKDKVIKINSPLKSWSNRLKTKKIIK